MRCLSLEETESLFGSVGFHATANRELQRVALVLESSLDRRQSRVGARPTHDVTRLAHFSEALNRWLPPDRYRLLWIDHSEFAFPSIHDAFMAVRTGLGEKRSLYDAPGHFFDAFPWNERDQMAISLEQARETSLLVGLMSLVMIDGWDGWLIADGTTERIGFWEGNIFMYGNEPSRVAEAETLFAEFGCPRALQ
jgi:hypothetical protein